MADPGTEPGTNFNEPGVYGPTRAGRRAQRATDRASGLRGPALHHAMQAWNQQQRQAGQQQATADVNSLGIDTSSPLGKGINARKFMAALKSGQGPAFRRMQLLQAASKPYQQTQKNLTNEETNALNAGAPVAGVGTGANPTADIAAENALLGNLESYAQQNLGVGLTPAQMSAYRATMRAPLEAQYAAATQAGGQGAAAAGVDPRSPMAGAQSLELERQREQGLSGVEQQLTLEDLNQRNFNEQEAQGIGQDVTQAREFDVNARLRRLAGLESGLAGMSDLGENQRQFDVGFSEAQKQAKLRRLLDAEAAKQMDPSGLEEASSILGGVTQGLGI